MMQNDVPKSVSGRDFCLVGGYMFNDAFGYTLWRMHFEATHAGIQLDPQNASSSGRARVIDPGLLEGAAWAAEIYRHRCRAGQWDKGAFLCVMCHIERDCGMTQEQAICYAAGAVLFCVDRSLARYQRGKNYDAATWAASAQELIGILRHCQHPPSAPAVGEKMKALNLFRHESNHAAREKVLREWERDPSNFPSAEKAGRHFTEWLTKEGINYEPRTVTGWIRSHAKQIGVRFR